MTGGRRRPALIAQPHVVRGVAGALPRLGAATEHLMTKLSASGVPPSLSQPDPRERKRA